MTNRRTYHTSLKDLVRLGQCPQVILGMIPRANIYRWKNESENKYYRGDEIKIESFQILLNQFDKNPGFFFACGRLLNVLKSICDKSRDFKNQLTQQKEKVVNAISLSSQIIPLKSAFKFFGISRNTYYNWKNQCGVSPIKLCKKRYSHQLTPQEVSTLEKLLTMSKFRHWGISSLQLWAKRNDVLHASLNTWYKYNQLFKWRKINQKFRKAAYHPLRATHPNEYWHADVSIHQCLDGTKGFIYTIIDNATRKIMAWKISNQLRGETMKEVLGNAMNNYGGNMAPDLVVDGGTENFNSSMDSLLEKRNITRLRATVDIKQSNSMIEAVFRQLKHQYLLRQSVHNLTQLQERVNFFFTDANQNKPLKVLNGLTPDEAYDGGICCNETIKEAASKAVNRRIEHNRERWCLSCSAKPIVS